MGKKLHRWLESCCQPRSDGTWLIEPVILEARPAPLFVLPDGASKESYLSRAVRLGRVRFMLVLSLMASIVPLLLQGLLGAPDGSILYALESVAPRLQLVLLLLLSLVPWWMGKRLRLWLERVGTAAGTQEPTRVKGGRIARWTLGPVSEVMLCRPAWMVVVEMITIGVGAAYMAHYAIIGSARCRRSLESLTAIPVPTDLAILCSAPSSLVQLLLIAAFLAFMVLAWRDWWHWNRRVA